MSLYLVSASRIRYTSSSYSVRSGMLCAPARRCVRRALLLLALALPVAPMVAQAAVGMRALRVDAIEPRDPPGAVAVPRGDKVREAGASAGDAHKERGEQQPLLACSEAVQAH